MSKKSYLAISILSFIVSAYFTILLFKSSSTGLFESIPMIAVAIIFEVGKWCLLRECIVGNHAGPIKAIIFSLWAFTTLSSIIASAGYVLNQANMSKNMNIEQSTAFQNQVKSRTMQEDLYATKKKELDNLIATKETNLKDLAKSRDSLPNDYITAKVNYNLKINEQLEKFNSQINAKSAELSGISGNLQKPIEIDGQVLSTSGYTATFQLASEFMNKNDSSAKKSPYKAETMELTFFLLLGCGLEILANAFAYLANKTDKDINIPTKKTPEDGEKKSRPKELETSVKPKEESIFGGRLQGVKLHNVTQFPTQQTKESDIQHYLNEAIKNLKPNGEVQGRTKMMKLTGFNQEKCRAIHSILKDRGILETGDRCTKIIREVV